MKIESHRNETLQSTELEPFNACSIQISIGASSSNIKSYKCIHDIAQKRDPGNRLTAVECCIGVTMNLIKLKLIPKQMAINNQVKLITCNKKGQHS